MKNITNKNDKILTEKQLNLVCGGGVFDFLGGLFNSKKSCSNSVRMHVLKIPEEFDYYLNRIQIYDTDGSEITDKNKKYEVYIAALEKGFPVNNVQRLFMHGTFNSSDENDNFENVFFTDYSLEEELCIQLEGFC